MLCDEKCGCSVQQILMHEFLKSSPTALAQPKVPVYSAHVRSLYSLCIFNHFMRVQYIP